MASIKTTFTFSLLTVILSLSTAFLVKQQPLTLKYHHGTLLKGNITVNIIWYGRFSPAQRSVIVDFLHSLSSSSAAVGHHPSAASWWRTTATYTRSPATLSLGRQLLLPHYPLGRLLKSPHLSLLSGRAGPAVGPGPSPINLVLTADDVAVEGFCMRCGSHGSTGSGHGKSVYIWVGNAATQCAGECAWPFFRPIYGPQTPALVAPNGDVGVDGMIINIATLLAGAVTNPFSDGYFQGPATAPLEAVSACTGVFGTGAYPGYPGNLLVDKVSGASFNAYGVNGRKFLVPAMWDPKTSACTTLV